MFTYQQNLGVMTHYTLAAGLQMDDLGGTVCYVLKSCNLRCIKKLRQFLTPRPTIRFFQPGSYRPGANYALEISVCITTFDRLRKLYKVGKLVAKVSYNIFINHSFFWEMDQWLDDPTLDVLFTLRFRYHQNVRNFFFLFVKFGYSQRLCF